MFSRFKVLIDHLDLKRSSLTRLQCYDKLFKFNRSQSVETVVCSVVVVAFFDKLFLFFELSKRV